MLLFIGLARIYFPCRWCWLGVWLVFHPDWWAQDRVCFGGRHSVCVVHQESTGFGKTAYVGLVDDKIIYFHCCYTHTIIPFYMPSGIRCLLYEVHSVYTRVSLCPLWPRAQFTPAEEDLDPDFMDLPIRVVTQWCFVSTTCILTIVDDKNYLSICVVILSEVLTNKVRILRENT